MFAPVVYSHRSHRPGDVAIETVDSSFVTSLLPANKLLGQAAWAKSLGKATSRSLVALAISLRPPRDARQAARARDLGDQPVGVQPAQQAGDLAGLLFWLFGEREWSSSEL